MARVINVRGSDTSVFDTSNVSAWPLSTRMHVPDGRVFRYAKAGSVALSIGKLVSSPAREPQHANLAVAAGQVAGERSFTATLTDVAVANEEYKDGLAYFNDGTAQGQVYRIGSALVAAAGATVTVELYTALRGALGTTDQVTLIKNVYNGVAVSQALRTERAVGVPPQAITANYFFWAQTFGPMAVLQDGTLFEFRDVSPSTAVHGAVSHATIPIAASANDEIQATENISVVITDVENNERLADIPVLRGLPATSVVGFSLDPRADTEYSLCQLTIID
ncbi:hypothetical protein LCGC14_1594890 [marine sediment metagenome]|uniref:Uncharacterized protein n=2 Tax=marine sediment metagenome TaxID=412755 RepID=A0A0F9ICX9_9ZZZZ